MPRYYFHVRDGEQYTDLQGTVLPDVMAATREASRFAGALLCDQADHFWDKQEWVIRVEDGAKNVIAELRFSGCLNVDPTGG